MNLIFKCLKVGKADAIITSRSNHYNLAPNLFPNHLYCSSLHSWHSFEISNIFHPFVIIHLQDIAYYPTNVYLQEVYNLTSKNTYTVKMGRKDDTALKGVRISSVRPKSLTCYNGLWTSKACLYPTKFYSLVFNFFCIR